MARDCFGKIVSTLASSGHVEGIEDVPLLISNAAEPNAALLGHETGAAVILDIGLVDAVDRYARRALETRSFLSLYMPTKRKGGRNPDREDFAYILAMHMLDFVIHHELAHDVRGHLDVMRAKRGESELDEAVAFNAIAAGDDLHRFLEFDADTQALDMQLIEMDCAAPLASWDSAELEDAVFVQILAMILLCQILDVAHHPIDRYAGARHPAPIHRAIFYSDAMIGTLSAIHARDAAWFSNIHDQAWYEASLVAKAVGMPKGRWRGSRMDQARFDLLAELRPRLVAFCEELNARDRAQTAARRATPF